jgi:uncharacterized SAM-binding protein YcdF (DUF218 family)
MFNCVTRKRKWLLRIALALVILFSVLVAAAYYSPQKVLCVDTGPATGDVMVLLGGGLQDRAEHAAELYKEHAAPRIIVSGDGDDEINRQRLLKNGVPASAIQMEGKSRNTHENAEFTLKLMREQHAKRVILVTSWYHSRRALATFRKAAPDLKFYSCPSYLGFDVSRAGWVRLGIAKRIRLEYLKLPGYWIRYGVCPFY